MTTIGERKSSRWEMFRFAVKMIATADLKDIWRPKCTGCLESAPYCSCADYYGSDFQDEKWAEADARSWWKKLLYRLAGYR